MNIKNRAKQIPLNTRLKVLNEMAFISLLVRLGYREDKGWAPEEDDTLQELCNAAAELAEHIEQEIEQWEEDGRP